MSRNNIKCCPSCGRPLLPDDESIHLTPIQRRILNLIERHGEIYTEVLHTALYASDPNGGPDPREIEKQICYANKKLRERGIKIQRKRRYKHGQPWRLVQIAEAAE